MTNSVSSSTILASRPLSTEPFATSPERWVPLPFMKEGVKFLLSRQSAALFFDPGLGKTAITLAAFSYLLKRGLARRALVVAPLRVCFTTWPAQLAIWLDFNHLTYKVLHGPDKEDRLLEETDLTIINPEGLTWLLDATVTTSEKANKKSVSVNFKRWKALGYDTLIIDELTEFKHTSSVRFKILKEVHQTVQRRWGLTGSPAANGLEDLFGQVYLLDQGRGLGTTITYYRRSYFLPAMNGFGFRLKTGAEPLIYERLAPLVLRKSADEELEGLPKLFTNPIKFDLPDDARRVYEAVEDDLFAKIRDKTIVAANAGVATGKCRQIAGGAVYTTPDVLDLVKLSGKKEWEWIHDAKLDALKGLVDELQHRPLIVAYEYGHELERLREAFPGAMFVTDVPPKRFKERIEDPWNRGEIELLIGQHSSFHLGLNLQGAGEHLCFFTLTWDLEVYDQLIARLRRQGSRARRIMIHLLEARGTVDAYVGATLRRKNRTQQDLFEGLVKLAKAARHR